MGQQSLSISLKAKSDFANYYPGPNKLIVNTLKKLSPGDFIYVWGASGLGVSHLLQACCEANRETKAIYVDLSTQVTIDILEGLEHYDRVVIDHIDAIAGQHHWEQALFHLYNRIQATQNNLVIGAHSAPNALALKLADLISRLKAMLVLQLKPLNDADKLIALRLRAQHLGLDLPAEVGQYLLSRYDRDITQLLALLSRLDQASLRAQRKLTIPFVKQVLQAELE